MFEIKNKKKVLKRALIVGGLVLFGTACYKAGVKSAWPVKDLLVEYWTSKDGVPSIRLNGDMYRFVEHVAYDGLQAGKTLRVFGEMYHVDSK